MKVPSKSSGKGFIIAISFFLIILVVAALWFFVLRDKDDVVVEETPTPTITASPVPRESLDVLLGPAGKLNVDEDMPAFEAIRKSYESEQIGFEEVRIFEMVASNDSANVFSFDDFISRTGISVPNEIKESAGDTFYYTLFTLSNNEIGEGIIVELDNPGLAAVGSLKWEETLSSDLASLFGLDESLNASEEFLGTLYDGVAVRYKNFPDPFSTVDMGFVVDPAGNEYLIIVNSRDHIFSIIDAVE